MNRFTLQSENRSNTMILFPNAKINIGLDILRRRPDGYHVLSTVMAPTGWTDILEIVPSKDEIDRLNVPAVKLLAHLRATLS